MSDQPIDEGDTRKVITKAQALAILPDGDDIHTYRGFVGADWARAEILKAMDAHHFELTGPKAAGMNHAMGFWDEHGFVFVETKPGVTVDTNW